MTKVFLIVSVACNVWFLSLLLYDRIMETRFVRFLKGIAGLWRSLGGTELKQETSRETPPAETSDIIGKSRFRMASTRTTAAIPTQEAATSEKGIELSEEEATFDDGNTETVSRPAQVPEEKLDETFTSIPPSELEFGEDEPEDGTPDTPRATGSSFDEIDDGQSCQEPGSDNGRTGTCGKGLLRYGRNGTVRETDVRLDGTEHPYQGAYRSPAEETEKGIHRTRQH